MASNTELDPLVTQYQHEAHRPRADQALHSLKKIASMVKPIMRRRSWRVGVLAEFYPAESNLLGLNTNRGQKINLRLRYPGDANQFLPLEEVVDTMLHELCHNVIGPHNAEFHALWDQLRDEHEALMRKGYTGEGFLGRGERLGGRRIPMHEAKRRARAAAEQRRIMSAGSGQRLGGAGIMRGQDPRAVIAAAVDRRTRIQRGCASGTDTGRKVAQDEEVKTEKVTTTQADREDQNEAAIMRAYIDLIEEEEKSNFGAGYIPPSQENPAGPRSIPSEGSSKAKSLLAQQASIEAEITKEAVKIPVPPPIPVATRPSKRPAPEPEPEPEPEPQNTFDIPPETWTCEVCTLVNPINYLTCDACTVERPSRYADPPTFSSSTPARSIASKPQPKRETPNALKPKMKAAEAHARFEKEGIQKAASAPVGWRCGSCGNWMEQQWWTCSVCGRMKASS